MVEQSVLKPVDAFTLPDYEAEGKALWIVRELARVCALAEVPFGGRLPWAIVSDRSSHDGLLRNHRSNRKISCLSLSLG